MKYQAANKKGETLIEVIAALTSLVLAGIAAMTLVISVMTSTAISKEYLIAQNLAREGIEGVTNIRDTNWLLSPSEKATKWLEVDPADFYILEKTDDKFSLKNKGVSSVSDGNYQLWVNSKGIYSHDQADKVTPQPVPTFYRRITFSNMADPDTIKVTVKIYWENKSNPTTYELSSILANYEK